MDFIEALETAAGKHVEEQYMAMQTGDVLVTYACTTRLQAMTGHKPSTSIKVGVSNFVDWYRFIFRN